MTFGERITVAAAIGVAMVLGAGLSAPPAQAAYIVTLTQVGSDVVANGSGSINTAGLSIIFTDNQAAAISPSAGAIITGPISVEPLDDYGGFDGPASFGTGGGTDASSGSGDTVSIFGPANLLFLPSGYVSGDPLSDTATWSDQTFASLGVTPRTYVWHWGSGATADSFTLNAGAAAVPEPSGALLLALPLGLGLLLTARRRPGVRDERVP